MAKNATPFEDALANWNSLNKFLRTASESEAQGLLERERNQFARLQFLIRIYGHYNKLRTQRERVELVMGARK